jgi:hypothetical protein
MVEDAEAEQLPADAVHALLLEQATERPIDFMLPRAVKRVLYRSAIPGLGLRSGVRAAAAFLVTLVLLSGLKKLDEVVHASYAGDPGRVATNVPPPRKGPSVPAARPTSAGTAAPVPSESTRPADLKLKVVAEATSGQSGVMKFDASWDPSAATGTSVARGVIRIGRYSKFLSRAELLSGKASVTTDPGLLMQAALMLLDSQGAPLVEQDVSLLHRFVPPQESQPSTGAFTVNEPPVEGLAKSDPGLLARIGVVPTTPPPPVSTSGRTRLVARDKPLSGCSNF